MKINKEIPNSPGCYFFLDMSKKIIYIGKAKDLKKRVSSYFNKKDHDEKTKVLLSKINEIDFLVSNSEVEAMILENNLIKKYKPKYNINLKDSKSFAYIESTLEKFPRLISSRSEELKNKKEKGELFGPFTSGEARNQILDLLNKTFRLRTCKKLPKKKCIRYDLGICSGPCINKISEKEYLNDLEKAKLVLKGKTKEVKEKIKKSMQEQIKNENFEKAILLREQLKSLEYINSKQLMERQKKYDEDIINFMKHEDKILLMIFKIYKGNLENKKSFEFEYRENFLEEFLMRHYSENEIPKKIYLPMKLDSPLEEYLSKIKKSKVEIIIPKKGDLKKLMDLVKKNIEIQYFGNLEKLEELKKRLNLQEIPKVIECFDISHLSGTEVVGSMVQFRNAKRDKSNYRKFKIKQGDKNDDFKNMSEIVNRRYFRLKNEKKEFPNLIVIDGGLGQLNYSLNELNKIGVKIPIISLAKKFEEIYVPGRDSPIKLNHKNKARLLLQEIRDEAHRFAVKYQRVRRSNSYFKK